MLRMTHPPSLPRSTSTPRIITTIGLLVDIYAWDDSKARIAELDIHAKDNTYARFIKLTKMSFAKIIKEIAQEGSGGVVGRTVHTSPGMSLTKN